MPNKAFAARQLSSTPEKLRSLAVSNMADPLISIKDKILEVNAKEVLNAKQDRQPDAMIKRLTIKACA